jgi:restriction system protein
MTKTWMVRAGRDAVFIDDFRDNNLVSIGWARLGTLDQFRSRLEILAAVEKEWPEQSTQSQAMYAGQIFRFKSEIKEGDRIVSYDPGRRIYLVGQMAGPYRYDAERGEHPHVRSVHWLGEVGRDLLTDGTKNSLGAISTIFLIPDNAAQDIERAMTSRRPAEEPAVLEAEETVVAEDMQAKAREFVKDRAIQLDWEQMQRLVAGLLRAMGYKTRVSPAGPDRGKDIIASPDGFGFESPRIVVEVKHRQGTMGSQEIRSFLGGRHKDDKGLYVSTGGFTKDARYEAERASIPLSLMDIDDLVEALIDNYDTLDNETKQLLPLRRIYWPI